MRCGFGGLGSGGGWGGGGAERREFWEDERESVAVLANAHDGDLRLG
jgi:hypothetical protein